MSTSIKLGTAAMNGNSSRSGGGYNPNYKESFNARVSFVMYDDHDKERFEKYGGWEAIGTVECSVFVNNTIQPGPPIVARPLNSNFRKFPVINEIVRIIPANSYHTQDARSNYKMSYYYDDVVNTWDSPEHNAVPDVSFFQQGATDVPEKYNLSQNGVHNNAANQDISATGDRFKEKGDIRKLIHQPGDITIEGRFGHSIRFGGTNDTVTNTPWKGKENKPFVIIRNGQKESKNKSWLPTYEDLNKDGSSFYMLSGQVIGFDPANDNFESYHQQVQSNPKSNYIEPQNNNSGDSNSSLSDSDDKTDLTESDTQVLPVTGSATGFMQADEINFLPDNENEFFQSVEEIELGDDIVSDVPTSSFNVLVNKRYSNGKYFSISSDVKSQLSKGSYSGLSILTYVKTITTAEGLAAELLKLISAGKIKKNVARSILGIAINEQSKNGFITGGHYNHYGIQTDGSRWTTGLNNIQFKGQYFLNDGERIRAFAAFNSERDSILFMSDVLILPGKGFDKISYSENDSREFAIKYISNWWGRKNITEDVIKIKKFGYEKAKKLIL